MTPEEQTELVVLRCKTCNGDNQFSGPNGQAMVLHQSGCQKSEVERIPVVQRSAVEGVVEAARIAQDECYHIFTGAPEAEHVDEYQQMAHHAFKELQAALTALTTRYPSLSSPKEVDPAPAPPATTEREE